MKKTLPLLIVYILATTLLQGCGKNAQATMPDNPPEKAPEMTPIVPHLGDTIEHCMERYEIIRRDASGLLLNTETHQVIAFSEVGSVIRVAYKNKDDSEMSEGEIELLLQANRNESEWHPCPSTAGRWEREDEGAIAEYSESFLTIFIPEF